MNLEISIDIYTLLCVKQITHGKLLYSIRSSAWCSVRTEKGGTGMGGREAQEKREIYIYIYIYTKQISN